MRSRSIFRFLGIAVALLAPMLLSAGPAHGQAPDPGNAATWYQRAIEQYGQIPQATLDLIHNYDWDQPPSPEVRAAMTNVQRVIQSMQRGAALDRCDFNLDRSQGVEMMLPHLNKLRGVAKLARADVSIRLADGDFSGAADRISSLYRLGGHHGQENVIISSLVGHAIFSLSEGLVQTGLDQGAFDAASAAKLLGAVEHLGTNDPFSYVEALAGEQEMMVGWLDAKFNDPEGRERLFGMFEGEMNEAEAASITSLDEDAFQAALDGYDDTMSKMVEAFSNPDPEAAKAELAAMEQQIQSGELGPLVSVLMPALGKCYENKLKSEAAVASRIETLRQLAQGEAKPEAFANAAVWYLRAIELLENSDDPLVTPEALHTMRTFAADPGGGGPGPLTDDLLSTLAKLQPVFDLLRDGAAKDRCDFKFARDTMWGLYRSPLITSYAAGMHDCLRLLHIDAVRSRQTEPIDQTAVLDRLLLNFRVERHLSGDPSLASALVSHHHFNRTMGLVETSIQNGVISEAFKPVLMDEVERFGRSDPFSYIAAIGAARTWISTHLTHLGTMNKVDAEQIAHCVESVKPMTGDQAACLMVLIDTLIRNGEENLASDIAAGGPQPEHVVVPDATQLRRETAAWDRLRDIYDEAAIDLVKRDLPLIAPMLARSECDVFAARDGQPLPAVTFDSLSRRMRQARGDLREASVSLSDEPDANQRP